jgi:predicted extracellular nuclease
MKKIFTTSLILLLHVFFVQCSTETKTQTFYVANWNVENLFDTTDDPNKNDEEFTPEGNREWTEERLNNKFKNLASVIKYMNSGNSPDILGFQEVEHKALLEKLNEDYLAEENYKLVYAESLDKRGIDNGLFYKADLFELISFDTLRIDLSDGWPTRYILYAELKIKESEELLHLFVNHWPSRSGGQEKSEPNRIAAALVLKNFTDGIFDNDPNSNIIIVGDFNDDPTNASIYDILKAQELECNSPGMNYLYNTSMAEFKKGTGSYLYRGSWNMLDQIIVSRSFVENNNFDYICGSFEIIKPDFMINKEGPYAGSAIRTFGGKNYIGGYSDHYPVGAKFILKK